jgi:hypothetical protein
MRDPVVDCEDQSSILLSARLVLAPSLCQVYGVGDAEVSYPSPANKYRYPDGSSIAAEPVLFHAVAWANKAHVFPPSNDIQASE